MRFGADALRSLSSWLLDLGGIQSAGSRNDIRGEPGSRGQGLDFGHLRTAYNAGCRGGDWVPKVRL